MTCLDTEASPGRRTHAWHTTGLDIVDGHLCHTRRCVWCETAQHKGYGPAVAGAPRAWTVTP